MEENLNRDTGGVSFLGLLTLLFIGLKLMGHIAWSWIWEALASIRSVLSYRTKRPDFPLLKENTLLSSERCGL